MPPVLHNVKWLAHDTYHNSMHLQRVLRARQRVLRALERVVEVAHAARGVLDPLVELRLRLAQPLLGLVELLGGARRRRLVRGQGQG